ncbi:SCO7613 C-terminal domain-containing membrane protein [Streptomyces sp. NPDC127084]|uniref:SCO7613 C-terminal domain-containing membrane protein n=1 Tax=Streptomyces sp. NPDC127084 TaxID=3347133 RepID=UPI00365DDB27
MENPLPPAEELRLIDGELALLDARRTWLLTRRTWLVQSLQALGTHGTGPQGASGPMWPARPGAWGTPASPASATPRASSPSAQNVLLTLGGILLTIAAIAFTVVSWGHLGIGGRSVVLGVVTAAALAAPLLLLRRGLTATAEAVAVLGLVLTVLDAYALRRAVLPDTGAVLYTAVAAGVLAALWAGYGLLRRSLRTPLPVAVVAAQLPLPLWALGTHASLSATVWAVLATAAFDIAVALKAKPGAVRVTGTTGAVLTGGWSLLAAGWLSLLADSPVLALEPGLLLLAGGGLALGAAWREPASAPVTAAVAGLALVAAVGGVVRTAVPASWVAPGYLLCAVALLFALRIPVPRGVRTGLSVASALVHAMALVMALPFALLALARPLSLADSVWSGVPAAEALLPGMSTAPVILAMVAVVLWAAPRLLPAAVPLPRAAGLCGALVLTCCAGFTATAHPAVPYPATLTLRTLLVTAAFAVAVLADRGSLGPGRAGAVPHADSPVTEAEGVSGSGTAAAPATAARSGIRPGAGGPLALTALVCAVAGALSVAALGLATRPATFVVLASLAAVSAAAAVSARGVVRIVTACAAVLWGAGLVGATAATAGLPTHQVGIALLAVPAVTAVLAARLRTQPVALPVELTGATAGLVALGLAVPHAPTLALALSLAGVIAAGTALRSDRRPFAGYTAVVLFVVACWVRLGASDVSAPEAYTLPVTVPALVVGLLRRRRDPEASSWTAYGAGLAVTLVPSLLAAWGDAHWLRPLLLGSAALGLTLAGARLRLQALLVLGGATLALDALHELAPYVIQVVGALPRWLPPAVAGLLLLAVGATYERRLHDARRLRETLGRMR